VRSNRRENPVRIPLSIDERIERVSVLTGTMQAANNAIHSRTAALYSPNKEEDNLPYPTSGKSPLEKGENPG